VSSKRELFHTVRRPLEAPTEGKKAEFFYVKAIKNFSFGFL
jgi:hypothetical protein